MQTIIGRIIIISFMLICGFTLKAQSFNATYEYDANGNRTKATVIYLSLKSVKLDKTETQKSNQVDSLGNISIRVYPNPTQADLLIEINGVDPKDFNTQGNSIKIVNLTGQLILEMTTVTSSNPIDLSQIAAGTYVLKLSINGKVKSYKIVKN